MKICICDDDISIHEIIKSHINKFMANLGEIDYFDIFTAEDLIEQYRNNNAYDIIFLDIELGTINGIVAAEAIRKVSNNTIIVFVSNFPHYVFDTFRVEAFHFLVKPISSLEFKNVFERAINKYKRINSSIALKWQGERYIIKIDTIKYVEGYKRHITIYTQDAIYETKGKIPEILNQLAPHGFIRTHQGFIVNMDYIKRFDLTDVVLFDGTKVMISVRKRSDALQAFDKYLKTKKW